MSSEVAVVMVPLPAQGHLNQLLHLSHIITSHDIPVHYVCSSVHNRQAKLRLHGRENETSAKIQFHNFELPCKSPAPNPTTGSHFPTHLQPLFDESPLLRQPVSQFVLKLSEKVKRVVVIHDNMMTSSCRIWKLFQMWNVMFSYRVVRLLCFSVYGMWFLRSHFSWILVFLHMYRLKKDVFHLRY